MLVFEKGKMRNIADERVKLIPNNISLIGNISMTVTVRVDGLDYTNAVVIYVEHKQFKMFMESASEALLTEIFGTDENYVFVNAGLLDLTQGDSIEFRDYTAKAREGINYFEDVITPSDRNCDYKDNYIAVEVRL